MDFSLKLASLVACAMLASSAFAQGASAKSRTTQSKASQTQSQSTANRANARNPGVQAAKTRVENVTNYGTVKSSDTYTVNKSTDPAKISREQNAVERKHQNKMASKYSAKGKPVPSPAIKK